MKRPAIRAVLLALAMGEGAQQQSGKKRGFGLSASISMLFWGFPCRQVVGTVLSFLYFGVPGMVLSLLVALLVGLALG